MDDERTIFRLIGSVYLSLIPVVLISLAGYSMGMVFPTNLQVSNGEELLSLLLSRPEDFSLIMIFIILISPYYLHRSATLDRRRIRSKRRLDPLTINLGIQQPLVMLVLFVLLISFPFYTIYANTGSFISTGLPAIIGLYFGGLLPFAIVAYRNYRNLAQGRLNLAFSFSESRLVPILVTVLVCFTFGWSIALREFSLLPILITNIAIYLIIGLRRVQWVFPRAGIAFLAVVFLIALFPNLIELRALFWALLLFLQFALSELSIQLYRVGKGDQYFSSAEDVSYLLATSNWSYIVLPLTVVFVPIIVPTAPAWPFLGYCTFVILYWLSVSDKQKIRHSSLLLLSIIRYIFVLMYIVIPVIRLPDYQVPSSINSLFFLSMFLAIVLFRLIGLQAGKVSFIEFLREVSSLESFLSKSFVHFFALVCFVLFMVSYFNLGTILYIVTDKDSILRATREIMAWSSVFLIFLSSKALINEVRSKFP